MTYRHKLTGNILVLKKDYGEVVSCFTQERTIPGLIRMKTDVVVCDKENLIAINTRQEAVAV